MSLSFLDLTLRLVSQIRDSNGDGAIHDQNLAPTYGGPADADVYVLSRPTIRYDGIVDSVGFGVQPDSTLVGTFASTGLPDVQRSLNWVHLATRFPVRVRINAPESEPFRLSESAVVVIRGSEKAK